MSKRSGMERRTFLKDVSMAAAGTAVAASFGTVMSQVAPAPAVFTPFAHPPLPYAKKALDPFISEKTVTLHYDVHHKGYIDACNKRIASMKRTYASLEETIKDTVNGINLDESLFRVASLAWNHNMYWPSMKPEGGGAPGAKLKIAKAVTDSFGSYDKFAVAFKEASVQTGIGWVWLFSDAGKLSVVRTDYFTSPVAYGKKVLLALDVWEHAYYLDYQFKRDEYVDIWLKRLVNWDFAEKQLSS